MMAEESAGILLFKRDPTLQVLLAHPGGPYWKNRDEGAWSIPKGVIGENEDKLQAAIREFEEEIGYKPVGNIISLGSIKQKGGKVVYAWAIEDELPGGHKISSNTFSIEWPPNTGNIQQFPEIDRAVYYDVETARSKINTAQTLLIDRLVDKVAGSC